MRWRPSNYRHRQPESNHGASYQSKFAWWAWKSTFCRARKQCSEAYPRCLWLVNAWPRIRLSTVKHTSMTPIVTFNLKIVSISRGLYNIAYLTYLSDWGNVTSTECLCSAYHESQAEAEDQDPATPRQGKWRHRACGGGSLDMRGGIKMNYSRVCREWGALSVAVSNSKLDLQDTVLNKLVGGWTSKRWGRGKQFGSDCANIEGYS